MHEKNIKTIQHTQSYDLFVIGGGSGGVRAARWAASKGLRVGIAEGSRYGGTCVNVGCVPKKIFFHASHSSDMMENAHHLGWNFPTPPHHNWQTLFQGIQTYLLKLNKIYHTMLQKVGVDCFAGWASFVDPYHLVIRHPEESPIQVEAKHILIATGGQAKVPHIPGVELAHVSDDFFARTEKPQSALIIGGGYIGVELAGVLSGLGVETSLALRGDLPLRGFEPEIRQRLDQALRQRMHLYPKVQLSHITKNHNSDTQVTLTSLEDETICHQLEAEFVLLATGRQPNTSRLDLSQADIKTDPIGAIIVDDHYRTNHSHIFAVGDVINKIQLTPVALAEAMRVVDHILGQSTSPLDYDLVPTTVFSHPNIARVGLGEQEAIQRGMQIQVYESDFRPLSQALNPHPQRVYMKLIVDQTTDRVLGCHMIGDEAGEQMQGLAAAMQAHITKKQLDQTIGIHPTMAEEWVTMRTPRD